MTAQEANQTWYASMHNRVVVRLDRVEAYKIQHDKAEGDDEPLWRVVACSPTSEFPVSPGFATEMEAWGFLASEGSNLGYDTGSLSNP